MWASRSDGPEVTDRPCQTSTSLDMTTTPQRPGGGTHCQLDQKQTHIYSYKVQSMKSTLMFMVENSHLVQPRVHHWLRFLGCLLFPCIWGEDNKTIKLLLSALMCICSWRETTLCTRNDVRSCAGLCCEMRTQNPDIYLDVLWWICVMCTLQCVHVCMDMRTFLYSVAQINDHSVKVQCPVFMGFVY